MKCEIKDNCGKLIFTSESENLRDCLEKAVQSGANLYRADLSGANLYKASLSGADLSGVNLYRANLSGAYLYGARGINKFLTTALYLLLDQTNPIRAYKIVNENNEGIYWGGPAYEVGQRIEVDKWDSDENKDCAAGINLATLDWCLKEWKPGRKLLLCEFDKEDIVCIPIGSDGKFRVKACTPIKELSWKDYRVKVEDEQDSTTEAGG